MGNEATDDDMGVRGGRAAPNILGKGPVSTRHLAKLIETQVAALRGNVGLQVAAPPPILLLCQAGKKISFATFAGR